MSDVHFTKLLGFLILTFASLAVAAPPTVDDLISQIKKGPVAAKLRAIDAIGAMGRDGESGVGTLIGLSFPDETPNVRLHAIRALGKIGSINAIPILQFIADGKSESPPVKNAAKQSLAILNKTQLTDEQTLWVKHAMEFAIVNDKPVKLPRIDFSKKGWYTLEVGAWGDLDVFRVEQVIGEREMVCSTHAPTAESSNKKFTVIVRGFPTAGLADGGDWYKDHPQILILGIEKYHGNSVFVFIPLAAARRGISQDDFKKMLADNPDALK